MHIYSGTYFKTTNLPKRDAIHPEKKRLKIILSCFHPLEAMPDGVHGLCDI